MKKSELRKLIREIIQEANKPLDGKVLVITGTLTKNRRDFVDLITRSGGTVKNSITGDTDILVLGKSPGSKLQKAQANGIKIITEPNLLTMLDQKLIRKDKIGKMLESIQEVNEIGTTSADSTSIGTSNRNEWHYYENPKSQYVKKLKHEAEKLVRACSFGDGGVINDAIESLNSCYDFNFKIK